MKASPESIMSYVLSTAVLGSDAALADQPVLPVPDAPTTGDPWADVAMFALRVVCFIGIALGPVALKRIWPEKRGKAPPKE